MSKAAILCVDDEISVLETLEIELQKAFQNSYVYEFASSADEALEIIEELCQKQIDILTIVSDWLMPGMKGDDFLICVHEKYPKIITVMLTGQADAQAIERAKTQGNLHAYLQKPWNKQEFIETIKSGIEKL